MTAIRSKVDARLRTGKTPLLTQSGHERLQLYTQSHAFDSDDKLNVEMPFTKFLCFLIFR